MSRASHHPPQSSRETALVYNIFVRDFPLTYIIEHENIVLETAGGFNGVIQSSFASQVLSGRTGGESVPEGDIYIFFVIFIIVIIIIIELYRQ